MHIACPNHWVRYSIYLKNKLQWPKQTCDALRLRQKLNIFRHRSERCLVSESATQSDADGFSGTSLPSRWPPATPLLRRGQRRGWWRRRSREKLFVSVARCIFCRSASRGWGRQQRNETGWRHQRIGCCHLKTWKPKLAQAFLVGRKIRGITSHLQDHTPSLRSQNSRRPECLLIPPRWTQMIIAEKLFWLHKFVQSTSFSHHIYKTAAFNDTSCPMAWDIHCITRIFSLAKLAVSSIHIPTTPTLIVCLFPSAVTRFHRLRFKSKTENLPEAMVRFYC